MTINHLYKLGLFFVLLFITNLITQSSYAQTVIVEVPCATPTCITLPMIEVAKHADVEADAQNSFFLELSHEAGCVAPKPTGVTVFKQIVGDFEEFPDSLCLNQGCVPNKGEACGL